MLPSRALIFRTTFREHLEVKRTEVGDRGIVCGDFGRCVVCDVSVCGMIVCDKQRVWCGLCVKCVCVCECVALSGVCGMSVFVHVLCICCAVWCSSVCGCVMCVCHLQWVVCVVWSGMYVMSCGMYVWCVCM